MSTHFAKRLCAAIAIWALAPVCVPHSLSAAQPTGGQGNADTPAVSAEPSERDRNESDQSETGPAESASDGAVPDESSDLNLLGQTDSDAGESRRNENVQFNLIDNNAWKELSQRLGTTATVVDEFNVQQGYFGAEFGAAPSTPLHQPSRSFSAVHGSVHWSHDNSIFRARSFFQVGEVLPARENDYSFKLSAPLWRGAALSLDGSQHKIRGSVNGNVLVPTPDERTPLTTDPAIRPIVERYLAAYPDAPPNRPDIDPRALNTNAPQVVDTDRAGVRVDQKLGDKDSLVLLHNLTVQTVDAFQLVAGQNPDIEVRSQRSRATWKRRFSAATNAELSAGFDRLSSLLIPEPNAVGHWVFLNFAIQDLGPSPTIPIDRAENTFRYAGVVRHTRGKHLLTAGLEVLRDQVNGAEADSHRGIEVYGSNDRGDAITNLRMGTPNRFVQGLGNTHRGYRNWRMGLFVGDEWRATPKLTLNMGLRYEPVTTPVEVNGLGSLPYPCDCNNLAPRFGFAYRPREGLGVIRAAYGLHYGEIFPATFGQDRFNPPHDLRLVATAPNLADPLGGVTFADLDPNARTSVFRFEPDLRLPYSHQYNFSWELPLARSVDLRLGYVGSRSHKLLMMWFTNRGQLVEGIAQESRTINDRRPDQSVFDVFRPMNGSIGYYDAARASLIIRNRYGFTLDTSYWFSKAIDLGTDYLNTISPVDSRRGRSQSEFLVQEDLKGLSNFDQPHAFLTRASYETPRLRGQGWRRRLFGSWTLSTVVLLKSGTPFTVAAGSDAAGFGNVDGAGSDRPHVIDPGVLGRTIGDPDTARLLLPAKAFAFMRPTDLRGSLGRNTFRKGAIANVNAAISRTWNVAAERKLTFQAESINFLNTPQFAEPSLNLASPSFGRITNTLNDGRTFRFLLRFEF